MEFSQTLVTILLIVIDIVERAGGNLTFFTIIGFLFDRFQIHNWVIDPSHERSIEGSNVMQVRLVADI